MKLTRTSPCQRPPALKGSIQSALICLGVPRRIVYRPRWPNARRRPLHGVAESFWSLPAARLWEILEWACRNFRRLIRRWHPDKVGDKGERARVLITAWTVVKRHFARRGFELA